ncbi:hypothetical protein HPP92_014676 [Vanilla planifolia]|uniref:Uncharacterized protein n=1 Tax=Vanilla planifolia TaxID=51239 RepID=A0A835QHS9_VANPL|nr:hypothetical protein HPP92_014676 [Vanilla planifolia]
MTARKADALCDGRAKQAEDHENEAATDRRRRQQRRYGKQRSLIPRSRWTASENDGQAEDIGGK